MTQVKDLETQLQGHIKTLQGLKASGKFTGDQIAQIQEQIHAIDEKV